MITSGVRFTNNFFNVRVSMNPSFQDPLDGDGLPRKLEEYTVTLSSGEQMYILAANSLDAAYSALELSEERNTNLININITDEW
tara:strand:+ start:775 stop:1026 length:252 start_codon:yes stop_codon:yes gene_type:complete